MLNCDVDDLGTQVGETLRKLMWFCGFRSALGRLESSSEMDFLDGIGL